jgi:membrane protease YdiL (CAAX protease family)
VFDGERWLLARPNKTHLICPPAAGYPIRVIAAERQGQERILKIAGMPGRQFQRNIGNGINKEAGLFGLSGSFASLRGPETGAYLGYVRPLDVGGPAAQPPQTGTPAFLRCAVGLTALACMAAVACARPLKTGRIDAAAPESSAEIEARLRLTAPACAPYLGLFFPGLSQICMGERAKGSAMVALGAAELSTGLAVGFSVKDAQGRPDFSHPGATLPLLGLQDLYMYGVADWLVQRDLAAQKLYAPADTLTDLLAAPLNIEVMKRPSVWVGLLGALALGVGASLLVNDIDGKKVGTDPQLFGRTFHGAVGYPLGLGIEATLFAHVAPAEETFFRGVLQSSLARSRGENTGWLLGSLIFGLVHAPNAFALPEDKRVLYLAVGVPVITLVGTYMGWIYKESGYSLAPSTAFHFWYDFLLGATFLVLKPKDSDLSAAIAVPF